MAFCYKVEKRWIMKFPEKIWFVFSKWDDKRRIIKDYLITGSDTMKKPHGHNHSISELVEQLGGIQSSSHVQLFATPWAAACQASLSLTKFVSIASALPSSHPILWCPLLLLPSIFPASETFPMSWLFASDDQNTGTSASASVFPMSIQDWFPLRLTQKVLT